jgi:GABA permease
MRRYLVVSNQTLTSEALVEKIRSCLAAGPCQFHLVVPATHGTERMSWTEGHDRRVAQERLDAALARFAELGADVTGEVGDARALYAMDDAMRDRPAFDEVILFTLPPGLSRWLKQDLPHRVQRRFNLPVTHIVAEPVPA